METSTGFCRIHRDRRAEGGLLGSSGYCAACRQEIAAALRGVSPSVVPRECFASPLPDGGWRACSGFGAAHWLAHELLLAALNPRLRCAAGFPVRRADLLFGRRELARELPKPRDLWVDLDDEGCGLVVVSRRGKGDEVEISIRGLIGWSGSLAARDFYRDLSGRGRFFR